VIPLSLLFHTPADLMLMKYLINCALVFHFLIYYSKFFFLPHAFFDEDWISELVEEAKRCTSNKVSMSKRWSECLIIKLPEDKVKEMAGPRDKAGMNFFFVILVDYSKHNRANSIPESTRGLSVPISMLTSVLLYW